jgi:hyperosmotically inducible protein
MKKEIKINTHTLKLAALAITLVFGASNELAAEEVAETATYTNSDWQTPLAAEFSKLDTSGNGLLKPNEAMKNKAFNAKTFAKADVDHDGSIDQNEYVYFKTGAWPVVVEPSAAVVNAAKLDTLQLDKSMETTASDTQGDMVVAERKSTVGNVIDDSIITTKAKAKILATEDLKSLQISVETHQGEVILSGFVDNEAAKMKAEEVVSKIEGVKSVKNGLEIRS